MAPTSVDNPAGRLHSLLLDLHAVGQEHGGQNILAWDAWVRMLAPEAAPHSAEFVARFATVLRLPAQIREAVADLDLDDEDKADLLEHLEEVEQALAATAARSHPLGQVLGMFAPNGEVPRSAAMKSLSTCSRSLHKLAAERTASDESLSSITDAVTALMQDVVEADLPADVKRLLLTHLQAILAAVQNVRVAGLAPVEEATDALTGALGRRPSFLARLKMLPQLLLGVQQTITTVNAALATGHEAEQLAEHVMKMLGG